MNAVPSWPRRLAVTFALHAARILPGAGSPWADAMRRELDYIDNDSAALRWALGCMLGSYRARLIHRPLFRARWSHLAASAVLMLLIGLSLQDHAGGQTEPPRPALDRTTCDLPAVSPDLEADLTDSPAQSGTSCTDQTAPIGTRPRYPAPPRVR